MSTLTDQDAFVHAICTDPGEDTHRLVYADWLDEHGDAERAEFIRVGCELWHLGEAVFSRNPDPTTGKKCLQLENRSAELLKAHERDWRGGAKCLRCSGGGEPMDAKWAATEGKAIDAFHRACVAYGRKLAGLPELKEMKC